MKPFILLLLAALSSIAFAQKVKVDTLRTYHIEEVTVTAKKGGTIHEILPAQTMSGIELQKLSAHSVADAIRYFSGAQIKDYGGIGGLKTVNIRSMGTNHVGVFYDGIELGNAQNGTVDLGRFSLDNMESVTLYNGQKSNIFQPAKDFSSSGSIYLQTKTPAFEDHKKYNISATFKTGSFGLANPSLLWEQKLSEKVNTSVSTEYMHTTGRYKFRYRTKDVEGKEGYDTTAVRENGDVNALRAEAGLYGKIAEGYWRTKAYVYRSERGYPAAVVRGAFQNVDRQWDTNFFLQGTYKKNIGKRYGLMLNGKYAYDYVHFLTDARKDNSVMHMESRYRQQEAYISTANRINLYSWWDINFSADFQFNTLDSDLELFPYPRRYTTLLALASSIQFEHFKLQCSLLSTFIQDRASESKNIEGDENKLSPTLIASYRPWSTKEFNVRAFYKEMFRMPTFNDLYYSLLGSSKLKPEYTTQYNVGVTYGKNIRKKNLNRIEVQLDGYYNKVKNKIIALASASFLKWSMSNIGTVKIKGIDASVNSHWTFGKDWTLHSKINYTYQKAQDFTSLGENSYGGQIPYIPWHSSSFIFNGSYREWELNYSFIYTGERYSAQTNILANYQLPWYTSDLSLAYSFRWNKIPWRATLEINNLLNQQYEVVNNYPMPGTNFRIILNVKL